MRSFILIFFLLCTYQLGAGIDKGSVAFIKGRAFIERGIKTLPAKLGSILKVGDKVNVEEGSQVSIELFGSGLIKITEKTSFQIPETEAGSERTSKISLFFGGLWVKAKKLLKGESFEIKTPTATAGVRGTTLGTEYDPDSGETGIQCA
ncbi:FecR domain-containing protein, partial [bacterium]|nr:FecR domain-containing protein [bacterium]